MYEIPNYEKRAGDAQRQDTIHHLAACASSGHLTSEEAESRMDKAAGAVKMNDLIKLLNDLPDPAELRATKMASIRVRRVSNILLGNKVGRGVLHSVWAIVSVMVLFAPTWTAVDNHWNGPGTVFFCCLSVAAGLAGLVTDAVALNSYITNH